MVNIGPVLPSGKFYYNYSGKKKPASHKANQFKLVPATKTVAKSLTKKQKKEVKKLIGLNEETKYHAEQLLDRIPLDWAIHTYYDPSNGVTAADTLPLVPRIAEGNGDFQRVGTKIKPSKCRVDIELALMEPQYGNTMDISSNIYTKDIYVVMYVYKPKDLKNFEQFVQTKANTITDFLDNGDGTSKLFGDITLVGSPPTTVFTSNARDLMKPVNTKLFTLLKKKVVRLTKNYGITSMDGASTDIPNIRKSSWRGSFTYKLPTLRYDDSAVNTQYNGGYPTNTCVVLGIGACLTNGNDAANYVGGSIAGPMDNAFIASVRSHYWYKDA